MSSIFVLFRYHTETETYRYLHEIKLTTIETENIIRYGTRIIYIQTIDIIDIIQLFTSRPIIKTIQIEQNNFNFESDSDSDPESENEIYYTDLINEIIVYAEENIHLMWIDPAHQNYNFCSICDDYCNPYPLDVYIFD